MDGLVSGQRNAETRCYTTVDHQDVTRATTRDAAKVGVSSIRREREEMNREPKTIVIIDGKDHDYGTTLIPELECEHLVCFSSKKEMSDHMRQVAEEQSPGRIGQVYSVQKLKNNIENEDLKRTLSGIFAST